MTKQDEYEWIEINDRTKYRVIETNGEWTVIKFYGNAALYSFCKYCGFTHDCYKEKRNEDGSWGGVEYDCDGEFNYCPKCGTLMKD